MEVHAFDLGAQKKSLRLLTKEKNSGVCWLTLFKQIQMRQDIGRWRVLRERVLALPRLSQEPPDVLLVDVIQSGITASRCVKRKRAQFAVALQIFHQAGVNGGREFRCCRNATTNHLRVCHSNEVLHFRMAV